MTAVTTWDRPAPLRLHGPTWWEQLAARLRAHSLDADLAAGRPATATRLLAVRAGQLVNQAARERLARHWLDLLARARMPLTALDPRVPVRRGALLETAELVHELVDALRSPRPTSPQGVAMARLLLTSGTSPVYAPGRGSAAGLADAVGAVVRRLPLT
jgi:hypothetical protein